MTEPRSSGEFERPSRVNGRSGVDDDATREQGGTPTVPDSRTAAADPGATEFQEDAFSHDAVDESQCEDSPLQQVDRYKVDRLLGSGGFGSVYLANDEVLRRQVTVKIPHRRRVRTAAQMQRYMNEAMMVAQLDHPKIVPVFDVGTTSDGICYVVSKYVESKTLSDVMKRPMSAREALEITIDLAETLQFVHEKGIVHRDLKPANVLVSREGELFINDFGLAMIEISEKDQGLVIGTPAYMSPEQAYGEGHLVDGRSDIFSLGVMLYEMLVGRRPFRGGSTEQVLYQIRTIEPKPLRQLNRSLPVALDRVCLKALAKQTGARYPTAHDFADDLRRVLDQWDDADRSVFSVEDASGRSLSGTDRPTGLDRSNSAHVSDASGPMTSGDDARVTVVPKGLRSYDQRDAAFFKSMLPGPYDLDGCPESILFWKHRIDPTARTRVLAMQRPEVATNIEPFRVGVVYGTSGCGKSSFMRAGLIPMLAPTVRVCLVDASAHGTLERLDQALAKQVPTFDEIPSVHHEEAETPDIANRPTDMMVRESGTVVGDASRDAVRMDQRMASIRRGENLPGGEKVLIVIDQFEQWLNSADVEERSLFVRALRQCDGERLQAIFLVRDDFWLATSRLMRELDIELSASDNLAMIDLLDKPHSRKLLRMLGRAYGTVGADGERLPREQRQFINEAVEGLASGDRVVAVQLALFAELMKSRTWNRATLKGLSGIDRIVERFLHESFDAQNAPKNQTIHRDAAHRLLGAMLPETGLIRAGSIEKSALARAAGYGGDPAAMDDIIRVLDNKLKLITPVESDSRNSSGTQETRYQLTHDSLVPAVRRWLAKYQEGSLTGRAKRDLKSRTQAWADGRDSRQLPTFPQWVRFASLTRAGQRAEDEQAMMSIANRNHFRSVGCAMVFLLASFLIWRHYQLESRADRLVNSLGIASTEEIPGILNDIEDLQERTFDRLRKLVDDDTETERARFLSALPLPTDTAIPEEVYSNFLLSADLDFIHLAKGERPDLLARLVPYSIRALRDESRESQERLRAGLLVGGLGDEEQLATDVDLNGAIEQNSEFLAQAVSYEAFSNAANFQNLVDLGRPLRNDLSGPLVNLSWDTNGKYERDAAAKVIEHLHSDSPYDLVSAALDLRIEYYEPIVARLDLTSLQPADLESLVKRGSPFERNPGQRVGRALALGASMVSHEDDRDESPWSSIIGRLAAEDRQSVAIATFIHTLLERDVDLQNLLNGAFEQSPQTRSAQLELLGEALALDEGARDSFKQQCLYLARDRFENDPDPGVIASARWLLIRLGDQEWLGKQIAARMRTVRDEIDEQPREVSRRLRINTLGMFMVTFPANTIAATQLAEDARDRSMVEKPLPYALECSTDEVTIEQMLAIDPTYDHRDELTSKTFDSPAGVVLWNEGVEFCNKLTLKEGMTKDDFAYEMTAAGDYVLRDDYLEREGYRLPTAGEWCAIWDADPARVAAVMDDSLTRYYARLLPHSNGRAEPVGGTKPDRNGVFHMASNALEWVSDDSGLQRATCGIYYGWELKNRDQIRGPSWREKDINWKRVGFRVVRTIVSSAHAPTGN